MGKPRSEKIAPKFRELSLPPARLPGFAQVVRSPALCRERVWAGSGSGLPAQIVSSLPAACSGARRAPPPPRCRAAHQATHMRSRSARAARYGLAFVCALARMLCVLCDAACHTKPNTRRHPPRPPPALSPNRRALTPSPLRSPPQVALGPAKRVEKGKRDQSGVVCHFCRHGRGSGKPLLRAKSCRCPVSCAPRTRAP